MNAPSMLEIHSSWRVLHAAALVFAATTASAVAQPFVKVDGSHVVRRSEATLQAEAASLPTLQAPGPGDAGRIQVRSYQSEPAPGGGSLDLATFVPPTINSSGSMAFVSRIEGSERNQGIFVAGSRGMRAIVIGCGGGGGSGVPGWGCGDPSPVGGTFSGLFGGTIAAPAINRSGDVLFLADVYGGTSPRGLFLYRASTRRIVKIAAVGDPSPSGGLFAEIGPGSLNDRGEVAFLAGPGGYVANIYVWRNGTVSAHASVGDPAPDGGTFSSLGREWLGYSDGTMMPVGPVPDINKHGQVAFAAIVSGGATERGMIVTTGGAHHWYARSGDSTPDGGTYVDFAGPVLNDAGQMAFFADYELAAGGSSGGWFVGSPSGWRKALSFYDTLDGGICWGLAFSRNPMQPLDENGDLLMWGVTRMPDGSERERLVMSHPNGSMTIVAREGDPAAMGGLFGWMDAWPSLVRGRGALSAFLQGGSTSLANLVYLRNTRKEIAQP